MSGTACALNPGTCPFTLIGFFGVASTWTDTLNGSPHGAHEWPA